MTSRSFRSGVGATHDRAGRDSSRPSTGAKRCEHRPGTGTMRAAIARPLPEQVDTERREEIWAAELQARFDRVSRWRGVR